MFAPSAARPARRRPGAALVACLTAAALAALPMNAANADRGPAPGPDTATAPRLLVGMGDSYSTGSGIPPADPTAGECHRSLAAYPMVAADQLGFTGRNVACGGARLAALTAATRPGVPPQVAGIGDADVVAVTIGGNDLGGPGGVLQSAENAAAMASFATAVDALGPQLVAGYTAIRQAAPAARLFVLGYPDIVPDTQRQLTDCLGPTAAGLDAPDVHANIALLNTAVADAAAEAGAVFVSTTPAFTGHEMCTETAYANAPRDWRADSPGGGLHPNELGHLAMAADLADAIAAGDPPSATSPPAHTPPVVGPPVVGPPAVSGPPWSAADRAAAGAAAAALRRQITARLLQNERSPVWGAR